MGIQVRPSGPAPRRSAVQRPAVSEGPSVVWRVGSLALMVLVLGAAAWFAPDMVAAWVSPEDARPWREAVRTAHQWAPVAAGAGVVGLLLAVVASRVGSRRRVALSESAGQPRSWWSQVPSGTRAVVWLAGLAGGVVAVLPVAAPDTATWVRPAGLGLAVTVSALVGWWVADVAALWPHRRQWVRPLHVALAPVIGVPPGTRPATYLRVPPDYATRSGEVVRVAVPETWTDADDARKRAVQSAVTSKLGLADVSWRWSLAGRSSYVTAVSSPRPPAAALFSTQGIRDLVVAAAESAPLIGVQHGGRPVAVDLDAESPHILVSAGTGGGKSVILRTVAAQMLHDGGVVSVLDVKRHSHKWTRGIPAVTYCRDIEDVHDELVRLGVEGERRNRIVDEWEGPEQDAPVGPRVAVLLEEGNATIGRLKRHWQTVRDPKVDPKESPALDGLREVLFMGRAVRMHVLMVAQSATAAALGGPEMRENFATRILARYTQNAWRMLVPEVAPIPRSTRHVGRAQVVLGGVAYATQVVLMTGDEARDWALSGRPADLAVSASQRLNGPVDLGKHPVTVTPGSDADMQASMNESLPAAPPAPAAAVPVSLRDATDGGVLSVSLAVARKSAAGRDAEFPEPVGTDLKTGGKLYRPEDLQRWERNRPKAGDKAADRSEL